MKSTKTELQQPIDIRQNLGQLQHLYIKATWDDAGSHFKNRQFQQKTTNLIVQHPYEKLVFNQLSFFTNKEIDNISKQVQNQLTKSSSIAHQDQNLPGDPHLNPILRKIHKKGSKNFSVVLQENDMILYSSDQSLNLQQNQYEKNFKNYSVQLKQTQSQKLLQSSHMDEKLPQIQLSKNNNRDNEKFVLHNFKQTRDACIQVNLLKPASQFRIFESNNISNLSFLELPSEYKQKPELVIRFQNSISGSMAESSSFASRNLSRKSPQNRISPRGRIKMPHLEHLESIHTVSDKEQEQQIDESFAIEQSGAIINKSGVIYEPLNIGIGIGGIKQEKSMDFRDHIKEGVSQDLEEYELPLNSQKICPKKSQCQQLALIQKTLMLQKLVQLERMNKQLREDMALQLERFWQQTENRIKQMLNRYEQVVSYKNVEIQVVKRERNRIQDELDACKSKLWAYGQEYQKEQGSLSAIKCNASINNSLQVDQNSTSHCEQLHVFNGLKIQISQPKMLVSEKQNEQVSPFSKNGERVKVISVGENRKALKSRIYLDTQERGEAQKRSCSENGIKTIKRKIMKEHY